METLAKTLLEVQRWLYDFCDIVLVSFLTNRRPELVHIPLRNGETGDLLELPPVDILGTLLPAEMSVFKLGWARFSHDSDVPRPQAGISIAS